MSEEHDYNAFAFDDTELDNERYYNLLEVPKTASQSEIKKSYYKLARMYHPDKSSGNAELFKDIVAAYETLSDVSKREIYDDYGETGVKRFNATQEDITPIYIGSRRAWTVFCCFWVFVLFMNYATGSNIEWILSTIFVVFFLWNIGFLRTRFKLALAGFIFLPLIIYFVVPPPVIVFLASFGTITLSVVVPNLFYRMHDVSAIFWVSLLVIKWFTINPVNYSLMYYAGIVSSALSIAGLFICYMIFTFTFTLQSPNSVVKKYLQYVKIPFFIELQLTTLFFLALSWLEYIFGGLLEYPLLIVFLGYFALQFFFFWSNKKTDWTMLAELLLSIIILYFIPTGIASPLSRFMIFLNAVVLFHTGAKSAAEKNINIFSISFLFTYLSVLFYFDQFYGSYHITWHYLSSFIITLLPRKWYYWITNINWLDIEDEE